MGFLTAQYSAQSCPTYSTLTWMNGQSTLGNSADDTKLGYTGRLCCHPVRAGQAGELGREEPDEVQQGQVQGPAPAEEQPNATVQARG